MNLAPWYAAYIEAAAAGVPLEQVGSFIALTGSPAVVMAAIQATARGVPFEAIRERLASVEENMARKEKLTDLPLKDLAAAQQYGLVRLHLAVIGVTHELLRECGARIRTKINSLVGEDGSLPATTTFSLIDSVETAWGQFWKEWLAMVTLARHQAAALPLGVLALQHDHLFSKVEARKDESLALRTVLTATIEELVAAADKRIYGDGLNLSQRVWRLNQVSRAEIERVIHQAVLDGKSAWQTSFALEQYLGYGNECPRWTRARLALDKKDIAAGDETGLLRGSPCEARGVAYAALRLARNEIQAVHHIAGAELMARSPWVEGVRIMLSGSHPKEDECDAHARGGAKGDGVYPAGKQPMPPFHPGCLCMQIGVVMDEAAFVEKARAALDGGEAWPPLSDYAGWLRTEPAMLPQLRLADAFLAALQTWVSGSPGRLWEELLP